MDLFYGYWLVTVVVTILYVALIVWFLNGWNNIPVFKPEKKIFNTKVSVIVPFYNEKKTIEKTLKGLLNQRIQTTEYEIICVDDHSTDGSSEIVKRYAEQYRRLQYLKNSGNGKKEALMNGIEVSAGDFIIMTDADCEHPDYWAGSLVEYYEQEGPSMIIGAVAFKQGKSIFQKFQALEFASLVGTGAGAAGINHAIMCNGASLAFKKEVYEKLEDPFNKAFVSGDDVFLMHNFKQLDQRIDFLKCESAIVKTKSSESFKAFFRQRVRWASKARGYKDGDTLFSAMIVFAISTLLFLSFFMLLWDVNFWKPLVFIYVVKTGIDSIYLSKVSDFFDIKPVLKWIPFFQILYTFYIPVVTVLSLIISRNMRAKIIITFVLQMMAHK